MTTPFLHPRSALFILLIILSGAGAASGQIPNTIGFQGLMTDENGVALPSGDYSITFRIYNVATAGTALWTEVQSVAVVDGIANATLGRINPFSLPFDEQYWLGITVGQNPTELSPRLQMNAVAYAHSSRDVADGTITEAKIVDGSVTNAKLADASVGAAELQPSSVTAAKISTAGAGIGQTLVVTDVGVAWGTPSGEGVIAEIDAGDGLTGGGNIGTVTLSVAEGGITPAMIANNAVEANHLANDAVTTDAIANGAVTNEKIPAGEIGLGRLNSNNATEGDMVVFNGSSPAWTPFSFPDGSVETNSIADGAVTGPKISSTGATSEDVLTFDGANVIWAPSGGIKPNSIGTTELANNAVTSPKIDAGAVNTSDLADLAVTTAKIADGAVDTQQLATGAVGSDQLAAASVTLPKIDVSAGTDGQVLSISSGSAAWTDSGIGAGSIGETELADNSVSESKIKTAAVTAGKIGNLAVGNAALADGAVSNQKISPATIDPLNKLDLSGASNGEFLVYNGGALTWTNTIPGDLNVTGDLTKGGGSFKIDHPLDPTNKYLYHSFVESSDMMNIYSGNAKLDAEGRAVVELPDWFEPLNKDFRYQLTCLGGYAPVYIEKEIEDGRFVIAGGTPDLKVSWQITAVRDDAWARTHRIQVEVEKPASEKGTYYHPEAANQ